MSDNPSDSPNVDGQNEDATSYKRVDLTDCSECGKAINPETPSGVCADCSLRNLLNSTFQRTVDFGSLPLVEHPGKDLTVDPHGRAQLVDPLIPGEQMGQFEIVRRLGRGGMGTVYEAQDIENQRRIALKVLNRPVEDAPSRQRFLREGRLAASINHPNSVFVFGTHQINSHSLISMELVSGGTLEQRVRGSGPLSSRVAVDVALQIIDGLSAAYDRGILHRDIKPANCFEASDGTIKIGDFGLSISTDPEFDARVTSEGTMLGTPAFSSPEQLRGDGLDVRSDIYALGVTLYYLLTGQTPYQADSLVKLLSQVFESSPNSPREIQSAVPQELSQVVMRCLAKEPGDRFRNYSELRTALLPLSSQVPEPASLGWRTVAGVLDWTVIGASGLIYSAVTPLSPEPIYDTSYIVSRGSVLIFTAMYILYFAVSEYTFGQTFGKAMLGLRTAQLDGGRPTFWQALKRASIYVLVPLLLVLPYNFVYRVGITEPQVWGMGLIATLVVGASRWGLLGILFSTARRSNAMAGLHDLASETRVVSCIADSPPISVPEKSLPKSSESVFGSIGPYQLLQSLCNADGAEMHVAYDPILLRRVWLRCENTGTVEAGRNAVARATRLRWLNQFQDQGKAWDVYEAPTGGPLLDQLSSRQLTHSEIAPLLADIAAELRAALADGTVPQTLSTTQLWLTDSNRLKLLGFASPGLERGHAPVNGGGTIRKANEPEPSQRCRALLRELASPLRCSIIPRKSSDLPPPLYVTNLLTEWENGQRDLNNVLGQTKVVANRRPISARRRRFLMSAACYALPIAQIVFLTANHIQTGIFFAKNSDLRELRGLVQIVQETEHAKNAWKLEDIVDASPELEPKLGPDIASYKIYRAAVDTIAGEYSGVLEDPRMKSFSALMTFYPAIRQKIALLQESVQPTESELVAASVALRQPILEQNVKLSTGMFTGYGAALMLSMITWLIYVAKPAALAGLLFRGGVVIHGFQTAIVRMKDGMPAGRLRILLRALLAVIPGFIATITLILRQIPVETVNPQLVHPLLSTVVVLLAIGVAVFSNLFGTRSLADRIMGTAVVAK